MEKIEVAVRLRPLICNPAEINNSVYGDAINYFDNLQLNEADDVWRIERDSKTLRYIPVVNQSNEKMNHHSHNKSFGNGISSGCMSRQTSVGKIKQPPRHQSREENRSIGAAQKTRP